MSLGFAIIFQTTLLAFFEEIIKFLIVWFFKRSPYPVLGLFPVALLEFGLYFPAVRQHLGDLGIGSVFWSYILATYFLVLVKFLHVASSYVYFKARNSFVAVIYCTIWHATFNSMPLPALGLKYYLLLPIWAFLSSLAAAAMFLLVQKLLSRSEAAPDADPLEDRR
ncbi:hypothetical protein G6L29_31220 [Agrobacterium rhizogenes]|uniref:hypothetical protein n=1 Tax=Rhizobium rhizogenes TaxID=359 RepID=UPI00115E1FF3|nr:hypothetical protein [Rhizobium rhizogenes]NTG90864.1 hypothetical protein [Rhizobium rhizogenes]NTI20137.1 hypothetical protein [Rhizobium rhizogenes]NTI39186.1 hypothetical protein [Rhizobium rhizogenes]TRB19853.1 hypothetical protein EXN70_26635 [Rhizobium rhizogenes]WEO69101.1 hypothetical protein G6L54_023060 [Rhizobium rhizogenes]